MAKNLNIQEQLNNAFIEIGEEVNTKAYGKYLRAIQRDLIAEIDTIDSKRVKEIVMSRKIDIKDSVILFSVLSAVTTILNGKLNRKEKVAYAPIIALMGIYSIKRPKQFANVVQDVITTPSTRLNKNKVKVKQLLNEFIQRNEASITNSIKRSEDLYIRSNRRRLNNLTRAIRKDINRMLEKNKTRNTINRTIKNKYRVTDNVISRNLDTELHAQAEAVKIEIAKGNGATHKTWKSQGDGRVRETAFHNKVIGKRIPIESEFRAVGLKADAPGDSRLPPSDRIRCRCYLIFD